MHPNVQYRPQNLPVATQIHKKNVPVDDITSNMMRMGSMMLDANSGLLYNENVNAIEGVKKTVESAESAAAAT